MSEFQFLTPELQTFLTNAGANLTGGLAATWINGLLRAGGVRVRRRFSDEPEQEALNRAAEAAINATVADWQLASDDYAELWKRFGAWLVEPAVLSEFRVLLAPSAGAEFDVELLNEEFEAAGLAVDELGLSDFDALVQDLVGAFYLAASTETILQEPLKIGFLRQMADDMGALQRISERQLVLTGQSVDELQQLRSIAEAAAMDSAHQTDLLQTIAHILANRNQDWFGQQTLFPRIVEALETAKIDVHSDDSSVQLAIGTEIDQNIHQNLVVDLVHVQTLLTEIRDTLTQDRGPMTAAELEMLETRYRQSIVEWFETLTFQNMAPTSMPIALPLRDVYVELKAVAEFPQSADTYSPAERRILQEHEENGSNDRSELIAHLDAMRLDRWKKDDFQQDDFSTPPERHSIRQMLSNKSDQGLVILGDPGSGKSTLLHYLALMQAAEPVGATLPIIVPLAAYDDYRRRVNSEISLVDFLPIYYDKWRSQIGLEPLFRSALEEGRAYVLLDGLDEVLDTATRQFVAQQATTFIQQWQKQGNRFVVTSRIVGYREAMLPGNLPHMTVLDFGMPEIELFARQWCKAYEIWVCNGHATPTALRKAEQQERLLINDIRANASVEQLAANPLLLTMLALLRRQVGKLPDRRIELYDKYLETLIVHWGTGRNLGARTQTIERFDPYKAEYYLIDLAFWLQCNRPSGTATRQDLKTQLSKICLGFKQIDPGSTSPEQQLAAQREADTFLDDMRHFAGILAERGRDAYGFLHLTFQEYYAGRALARLNPDERWELLRHVLHQPRWREPILLCTGQLGIKELRSDQASELALKILNAGSLYEEHLHRDVFLAAAIAADNVGIGPTALAAIHERLTVLLGSAIPTVRDMAVIAEAHLVRLGLASAEDLLILTLDDGKLCIPSMHALAPLLSEPALGNLQANVVGFLNDENWRARRAAVQALAPLVGTDAKIKNAVVQCLEDEDSDVRRAAVAALSPLSSNDETLMVAMIQRLEDDDKHVRLGALKALAPLASSSLMVKDALIQCFTDEFSTVREAALEIFGPLVMEDEEIRTAALSCINDKDLDVRTIALVILAPAAVIDKSVRAALIPNDTHSDVVSAALAICAPIMSADDSVRANFLYGIAGEARAAMLNGIAAWASLRPSIEDRMAYLIQHLDNNDDDDVRWIAWVAETYTARHQVEARDAVLRRLNSVSRHLPSELLEQLLSLLPTTDGKMKSAVLQCLDGENPEVRIAAAEALAPLRDTDDDVRGALHKLLGEDVSYVRPETIDSLARLVTFDKESVSQISQYLDDNNSAVRTAAVRALATLVTTDDQVKVALQERLSDKSSDVRNCAIWALDQLISSDEELKAEVILHLGDDAGSVRYAAVKVLEPLVINDIEVKNHFIRCLDDAYPGVRSAAMEALLPIAETDCDIRSLVSQRLYDNEWHIRQAATRNLASAVQTDERVRTAIIQRLDDDVVNVRFAAINALEPVLATDEDTKDAVFKCLNDRALGMRRAAIRALSSLLPNDVRIKSGIAEYLSDVDSTTRFLALFEMAPHISTDESVRTAVIQHFNNEGKSALLVSAVAPIITADTNTKSAVIDNLGDEAGPLLISAMEALLPLVVADCTAKTKLIDSILENGNDLLSIEEAALELLVAFDHDARTDVLQYIIDARGAVPSWTIEVLEPLVETDDTVKDEVVQCLRDRDPGVRRDAVNALKPLVATDESVKTSLIQSLDDDVMWVRGAAVEVLASLIETDTSVRDSLIPWLGLASDHNPYWNGPLKRSLIEKYTSYLSKDPEAITHFAALLDDVAWPLRHSAAEIIIALPDGPPPDLLPKLRGLLNDMRGEESWSIRLKAAEIFVNDREFCQDVIDTAMAALDYATQPWYDLPQSGPKIRRQAVTILGRLDPSYQDEAVFCRLVRVMGEDPAANVRDAAYSALLRLAATPDGMLQ